MIFLCLLQKIFIMFTWYKQFQERPGLLLCQLPLNSSMNLDGPQYNTSHFSTKFKYTHLLLMDIVIEQFCN